MYEELVIALKSLLSGEKNFLANCSNFIALIFQNLKNLNWAGFYFYSGRELLLGPFQGKPACIRIPFGKGVCGTSAAMLETLVVPDVRNFPGHIACDDASKSEIVIPLIYNNELIGVLDIDSPLQSRFSDEDKIYLERLTDILLNSSDVDLFRNYYKKNPLEISKRVL
jgi:L-methionine (R)-S-oxide reductase